MFDLESLVLPFMFPPLGVTKNNENSVVDCLLVQLHVIGSKADKKDL